MKSVGAVIIASGLVFLTVFGISRCDKKLTIKEVTLLAQIKNVEDVKALFPKTAQEIAQKTEKCIQEGKKLIKKIIDVPGVERNFENTALTFDRLGRDSGIDPFGSACAVLKEVSPQEDIRKAASDALKKLSEFEVDWIAGNVDLYKAFKEYAQNQAQAEELRDNQRYFVDETMKGFKRAGLELPEQTREKVKKIQKELVDLGLAFSTNVATDNRTIEVSKTDLVGMDTDFIDALKKNDNGNYIVDVNMPNYFAILADCSVENTRKRMYREFRNRAYPKNVAILKKIIAKRDELAKLLGYKSYAHINLDNQMMKAPERAYKFIEDILVKLNRKEQQEFVRFTKDLPDSVALTDAGKFKVWDISFVHNQYKKKYLDVDENKLSEYFQLEETLSAMFKLYEQFFGVRFEQLSTDGFWHPEVKLVRVFNADDNELIGYLLLDLHPRQNKYGHAAHFGMIGGLKTKKGGWPSVGLVVANFPKSTAAKPSLLKRSQVNTLFHEFGHAMHHILGRTYIASQMGTRTKLDFIEVPSQMLEEWLWDADVLKKISKHYKTGLPISDKQIEKIIALKQFNSGYFWQRQALFALVALDYFMPGQEKNIEEIFKQLNERVTRNVSYDPEAHFYSSFGHLVGYGARYYGYLWSRVLSVDVFDHLDKQGILKPNVGDRYVELVLGPGGSKDPNILMREFLGREPNDKAFSKNLGLE